MIKTAVCSSGNSRLLVSKPFQARLVAGPAAEALRKELAELQDAGLQLVRAERRGAAGDPVGGQLRPPPGATSQQTEREVASVRNKL